MIYTFPNTAQGESQARAVQSPKEMQWTPAGWTVRTSADMTPGPSVLEQIVALEAQVTQRMLREAALGIHDGAERLLALDEQIATLRGQLP